MMLTCQEVRFGGSHKNEGAKRMGQEYGIGQPSARYEKVQVMKKYVCPKTTRTTKIRWPCWPGLPSTLQRRSSLVPRSPRDLMTRPRGGVAWERLCSTTVTDTTRRNAVKGLDLVRGIHRNTPKGIQRTKKAKTNATVRQSPALTGTFRSLINRKPGGSWTSCFDFTKSIGLRTIALRCTAREGMVVREDQRFQHERQTEKIWRTMFPRM